MVSLLFLIVYSRRVSDWESEGALISFLGRDRGGFLKEEGEHLLENRRFLNKSVFINTWKSNWQLFLVTLACFFVSRLLFEEIAGYV